MKKIIIGIIIGVGFTLGTSIFADNINSLIGMKVDATFPVTIEGKKVSEDAVLINGHTYLQVRAMGDALNYDISFDADLGVTLKQKAGGSTVTNNTYGVVTETKEQIQARHDKQEVIDKSANDLNRKIKLNQDAIDVSKDRIKKTQNAIKQLKQNATDSYSIDTSIYDAQIKDDNDQISKLQLDLDNLNSQLATLNVQPSPSPTPTP